MKRKRHHKIQHWLMALLFCGYAGLSGCNIHKQLNRERNEHELKEEQNVLAKSFNQYSFNGSRITWQVDSSDHRYRVSIQPLDSFSFSPQHGFKGKALSVEIEGYQRSGRSLHDSSASNMAVMDTQLIRLENSRLEKQSNRSTVKEKESKPGMSMIVGVLVVLLVVVAGLKICKTSH